MHAHTHTHTTHPFPSVELSGVAEGEGSDSVCVTVLMLPVKVGVAVGVGHGVAVVVAVVEPSRVLRSKNWLRTSERRKRRKGRWSVRLSSIKQDMMKLQCYVVTDMETTVAMCVRVIPPNSSLCS